MTELRHGRHGRRALALSKRANALHLPQLHRHALQLGVQGALAATSIPAVRNVEQDFKTAPPYRAPIPRLPVGGKAIRLSAAIHGCHLRKATALPSAPVSSARNEALPCLSTCDLSSLLWTAGFHAFLTSLGLRDFSETGSALTAQGSPSVQFFTLFTRTL